MQLPRKSIPQKLKMLLQREIGSECPFCGNQDVGHFQFHHINGNPSYNKPANLLMLCPICHSKITKGDISTDEVKKLKINLLSASKGDKPMTGKVINFHSKVENAVIGDNTNVTINIKGQSKKSNKRQYTDGCIGANLSKANYVGYLITRYHEYKTWEVGKEKMNYAIFQSQIKKKYMIGKTRTVYHIPEPKFSELVEFIHKKIDGTVLASIKKSKGQLKNYLSFDEYLHETRSE